MTAVSATRPTHPTPKPSVNKTPSIKPPTPPQQAAPQSSIEKVFSEFDKMWVQAHQETQKKIKSLNPEGRSLLTLQMNVNHFGFGTQMFAQGIECVRGSIQKVQQIGGS